MTTKYELLENDTLDHNGITLYRIRALKDVRDGVPAGSMGGYIYSDFNLSQEGSCWVYPGAKVIGDAQVRGDAAVREHSTVIGDAIIRDNAVIRSHCQVFGQVELSGEVVLPEDTTLVNIDIMRSSSMVIRQSTFFVFMYRIAGQMLQMTIGAESLSLPNAAEMALRRDGDGLAYVVFNNKQIQMLRRNRIGGFLDYAKAIEPFKHCTPA